MKQVTGRIELHCANDQRTPRSTESAAPIPFFLLSPRHSSKQNSSKQHPETAAQNTPSSDVFCLRESVQQET